MSPQPAWVVGLFAAIDARDAEAFCGFLDPEVAFAFGNLPTVHGAGPVREFVAGFFQSIAALRHRILDVWAVDGGPVIVRGEVTYTRLDGSVLTVPFANVFGMDGERVRDYRIYVDASALFAT